MDKLGLHDSLQKAHITPISKDKEGQRAEEHACKEGDKRL